MKKNSKVTATIQKYDILDKNDTLISERTHIVLVEDGIDEKGVEKIFEKASNFVDNICKKNYPNYSKKELTSSKVAK